MLYSYRLCSFLCLKIIYGTGLNRKHSGFVLLIWTGDLMQYSLRINGKTCTVDVDPQKLLLWVLREGDKT